MENKVVVITGGAGYIGRATAKRLANKGARIVLIVGRRLKDAQSICANLPNPHLNHFAIQASVIDSQAIKLAANEIKQKCGKCDVLINCAAVSYRDQNPFFIDEHQFSETFDVNVKGILICVKEFYGMLKNTTGIVINLSSMASFKVSGNKLGYCVSKAAVNTLTEGFAKFLGPVRFLAIAPAALEEPVGSFSGTEKMTEWWAKNYKESVPLKRIPTAEDVVDVIDSSINGMSFLTGNVIKLDGGYHL